MEHQINGSNGKVIKRKILFGAPEKEVVTKIRDTRDDLIVESAEVVDSGDFVLVRGYLNKTIGYFTASRDILKKVKEEHEKHKDSENKETEKKHKKEVICDSIYTEPKTIAIDGVMRHTTLWIPFEILINVEGARVGDKVVVESKEVKSLFKKNQRQEIVEDDLIVGILINDFVSVSISI